MAGGDSFGDATPNSDGQAEFLSQLTVEEADKSNNLLYTINKILSSQTHGKVREN